MTAAVGYIRVSTHKQRDAGVSLISQQDLITAHCQANAINLLDTYSDPGESGTSLTDRPQAVQAIAHACDCKAALIVYSLSRLFRNTIEALQNLDMLESSGARLVSLTELVDTSTAAGRFVVTIFFARDEWEARAISERTATAMRQKAKNGGRVGHDPTYGYRLRTTTRYCPIRQRHITDQEPDPNESAAVAEIIRLRKQRFSRRAIGLRLLKMGFFSRTGTALSSKTIGKILQRNGVK